MKIRIEISAGNMSYVLDKETDAQGDPQYLIRYMELLIDYPEMFDVLPCNSCKYCDLTVDEYPCSACDTSVRLLWVPAED